MQCIPVSSAMAGRSIDMARRTTGDDLYDFAKLIGQHLPFWAVCIVAVAVGLGGFLLAEMLFSSLSSFGGAFRNSRLSLVAGGLAFLLVLCGGIAGASDRRDRKKLVVNVSNTGDLKAVSWRQLENLAAEAYRQQGHTVVERGGSTADGGVDVEVFTASGESWLVQCKHWKSSRVGVKTVREMLGVLAKQGADKAIIITSGRFTPDAIAFAEGQPVELVNGNQFSKMLVVHDSPIDVPSTPADTHARSCPRCGARLVSRVARRGKHQGQSFWGCKTFPRCSYIDK